ncbi:MAG TPA: AIR synthase family protein [Candidatus Binatia bacterium]|nr:AIR synthase family protein [Candidatus Binatia bacterium]
MPRLLRPGKLPPPLLVRLLRLRGAPDRRVVVGARCGEDAAVVALGRLRLVLKSDPVTFTAREVGWYAVQVNANDVAVMGARPCWFQPTILLPPGTPAARAHGIMREIDAACRALDIAVTGGHTEVTDAVTRPIVAGDMQGLLVGPRIVGAAGARAGDLVLMTKAAGLEGTAILATERADALARRLPGSVVRAARGFRRRPGISVVRDASIAAALGASAMHDPTEGGVRAALHEIASASSHRLAIDLDRVPILPQTAQLCRHFGIDPLGLIGSGALLATIRPGRAKLLLETWKRRGIDAAVIGRVERGRGVRALRRGRRVRFPWVAQDEIVKALRSRT